MLMTVMIMIVMVVVVVIMMMVVVMMMVSASVRQFMTKRAPAFVEQPAADQHDRHTGKHAQNRNNLFRDDVAREQQRTDSQQEDADGVGEGDGGSQQSGMLHVAAGSDQIGGNDGLAMTRLQSVQRTQPEGDGDSGHQPSGAQLGLMQKLSKIVGVHTDSLNL